MGGAGDIEDNRKHNIVARIYEIGQCSKTRRYEKRSNAKIALG